MASSTETRAQWPGNARAAIALTFDNMGEAADLNRDLWPASEPIGNHYSVTEILPVFLEMVRKRDIKITYFTESWNLGVYPEAIKRIADEGHEVAWHAWQHEAWNVQCKDEADERQNFERSFGDEEGIAGFVSKGKGEGSKVERYRGFRPPGGVIHGERTLKLCREFGLGFISPAAEEGALVPLDGGKDSIVVLPFRWRTVDAYYYMDAFSGLRKMKDEIPEPPQAPDFLLESYIKQVDEAMEKGGFVSFLFHPFLTNQPDRLHAMERFVKYLVQKRDEGQIWLARCKEIEDWVRQHPESVGEDPGWDGSSWR